MLPLKKILYPTDFSEASYEALKVANELAVHFSAELWVVHAISPLATTTSPGGFSLIAEMEKAAQTSLQEVIKERIPKEVHIRQSITIGGAADEILRIAEQERVDLIVIGTHGQTGWRHAVFGSVAEKVVRLASCPVLSIRAPHKQAE